MEKCVVNHSYFLYITITARYIWRKQQQCLRMYGNKIFQKEMYKHNWEEFPAHLLAGICTRGEEKKERGKNWTLKKNYITLKKILLFGCTERVCGG